MGNVVSGSALQIFMSYSRKSGGGTAFGTFSVFLAGPTRTRSSTHRGMRDMYVTYSHIITILADIPPP